MSDSLRELHPSVAVALNKSGKECTCGGHQGRRGKKPKCDWKGKRGRKARVVSIAADSE